MEHFPPFYVESFERYPEPTFFENVNDRKHLMSTLVCPKNCVCVRERKREGVRICSLHRAVVLNRGVHHY